MSWWRRLFGIPPPEAWPAVEAQPKAGLSSDHEAARAEVSAILRRVLTTYTAGQAVIILCTCVTYVLSELIRTHQREAALEFWQKTWETAAETAGQPAPAHPPAPTVAAQAAEISTLVWEPDWERKRH